MTSQSTANPPASSAAQPPKPKKKRGVLRAFAWTSGVILLLLIAAGVIVFLYLDSIVKSQVEKQGTASTNLTTQLDSARVSLLGGEVTLNDLSVGSPKGFTAPQMLSIGKFNVRVGSLTKLRDEPIHIASSSLVEPKLVIERSDAGFNFKVASDQLPKSDTPPDPNDKPIRLIIDDLTITDATVVIRPNMLGLPQQMVVAIPSMNMKNVGSGEGAQNGAALKDVVMQVISVMAGKATDSSSLPGQLKQLMHVDLAQTVANLGPEAQKRIAAAIPGDLGKALGGIIGDPELMKDPGKAITAQLGSFASGSSDTQPSAEEAAVSKGFKEVVGGGKEKKKKKK